jgi:DNA polymerase I-like protein with 3'-5' exonuclease and polymerase domains
MTPAGGETWFTDCEWAFAGGRIDLETAWVPVVFCLVGRRSRKRWHFWGRDDGLRRFMEDHAGDLFVSHNNVAEMKYLRRLRIPPPRRWFDTYVAWRRLTNEPGWPEASLASILDQLKIPHLALINKQELQQKILHLAFDTSDPEDLSEILNYCFGDCDGCSHVYEHVIDRIDPAAMTYWCEYAKAVARMELRGIPIDVGTARLIVNSREAIVEHLIARVNRVHPIYDGLTFKRRAFLRWCQFQGIAWPWTPSKTTARLVQSLSNDAMKALEGRHDFIRDVRQVRKTIGALGRRLAIRIDGKSGRHYFSTWAFRSITGRNQPRNFIFGAPKWMRWLIVPESPDHVLVYLDFVAQEIGIAAALSGDRAMREMYLTDDAHMAFAIMAGAILAGATDETLRRIRKIYKTINLGVLYGQTEYGISDRLGISLDEARHLLEQHRLLFADYWEWSRRVVQAAYDRGEIKTRCGWASRVPRLSKYRTWSNWPIQATGGDIMRLTIIYLDRQGVRILAPVHDGFLLSCRRDQLDDLKQAVDYAREAAVSQVLGDFPLKWELEVHESRFRDKDGAPLWTFVTEALGELYPNHVIPE